MSRAEPAPLAATEGVVASEGWAVLHLFFRVRGPRDEPVDAEEAAAVLDAFCAEDPYQALPFAVVGQRADVGLVLLGPDLARLQRAHRELLATPLGQRLEPVGELGFVSLTEASEYLPADGGERAEAMREARMYPRLRDSKLVCFYPMSKRRDGEDNWYALPFERRKELMGGHAAVGRRFAGRVTQMITGAFGLSDWEWGVTLLADDPKDLKDVVYEMRFDEVSARYAEFGPFTVGLRAPLREALALAGLGPHGGSRLPP